MGAMKHYVIELLTSCVPDVQFGQDAIEYAIYMRHVTLTYDMDTDVANIMARYSELVEAYQRHVHDNTALLIESYGPLITAMEGGAR